MILPPWGSLASRASDDGRGGFVGARLVASEDDSAEGAELAPREPSPGG